MPAYRSSAEGEIRVAVVERLREIVPGCRIIHEINAESFGNRIDVLAVGADTLAAVEIKSSKDKLDRLPDQIRAMRSVSNYVFAALHEKFLEQIRDQHYTPNEARGAVVWAYPAIPRPGHVECGASWHGFDRWRKPMQCLPTGAINLLWREELHALLAATGFRGVTKLTMPEAVDRLRYIKTGSQITRAICATLRARECIEADPPIAANDNEGRVAD